MQTLLVTHQCTSTVLRQLLGEADPKPLGMGQLAKVTTSSRTI